MSAASTVYRKKGLLARRPKRDSEAVTGLMPKVETEGVEFLDFGCGSGVSLKAYGKMFGAKGKGMGLDASPQKAEAARTKLLCARVCDIRQLTDRNFLSPRFSTSECLNCP